MDRAAALAETDSADAAIRILMNLIKRAPNAYPARYALGSVYRDTGDFASAHREFVGLLDHIVFTGYSRRAKSVALESGVHVVDMTADFLGAKRGSRFIDDMHPSKWGAERIAEALEEAIRGYLGAVPEVVPATQ